MRGICKLTGQEGTFVDSHLIPRALTKHRIKGRPFIQPQRDGRPIRRQTSWYDPAMVTAEGEALLSHYDNWAIRELRRHRLVWDSWGPGKQLRAEDFEQVEGTPYGSRLIEGIDPDKLRLFFLSLLWRAAATDLPEFDEVKLSVDELERLRQMIVDGDPKPIDFYPVSLSQISTRGPNHNHTPIAEDKIIPAFDDQPETTQLIFRFYFDGLVAHFTRGAEAGFTDAWLGPQAVGYGPDIAISTVTYEASFQNENLAATIKHAETLWPGEMSRLYRMIEP